MQGSRTMKPEWHDSDAIMLAWPHAQTDWSEWLEEARETYLNVISAVNRYNAGVILLCAPADVDDLKSRISPSANVMIVEALFNDTWMRDYGFITCTDSEGNGHPTEFRFNGWGNKFNAQDDNLVNQRYLAALCQSVMRSSPIVAEGGALEINDEGHLLSTSQCLLNPERNGDLSLAAYEGIFCEMLGASKVTILEHGHLEGDDTDGHIDTLVRFTPDTGLVIQACENRPNDSHFDALNALCNECAERLPEYQQYRLPLPYIVSDDGDRLPASYANYLICNGAILLPIYGEDEDREAISVIQKAFPTYIVEPIDCRVLVKQYGSLHCISMQVPKNTLKSVIIENLKKGVSLYAPS